MNSQCVKSWKYSILFALFFLVNYAFSQKTISTQHQVWSQLFYTIKIKGKWSISGDALYRWNAENG